MPRGKGVYVDDDDSGDDSHRKVADEDIDEKTPDVHKPEPGSEPPD
ncbi:hypothetical protein V4U86_27255 [Mycobacterium sp. AMU20-3851]